MRDINYILKRVIIGVLIALTLIYLKNTILTAHAKIFNPSLYVSGNYLKPGNFAGVNGNYANLRLNWAGWVDDVTGPTDPIYVSVVLCRSWAGSGIDSINSSGVVSSDTTVASLSVQNTQVKCPFNNSPYNLMGNVSIITFKKSGAGAYNDTYFRIYTDINVQGTYYTDIQLMDITFDLHNYANINDYSNVSTSKQLDDINNSINSSANSIITNVVGAINNSSQFIQTLIGRVQNLEDTMRDDSIEENNSQFSEFEDYMASNGVITNLITMPVTLFTKVLNTIDGSCTTYNLGQLYGTDLTLPCINISNYLGSTLWGVIDVIISGVLIYAISRHFVKVFNKMSSLEESDVIDD